MGKVITEFSMSLDGYIAGPDDEVLRVFAWYFSGEGVYDAGHGLEFRVSPASAELLEEQSRGMGALVSGRRTFNVASGWGGEHPYGIPCFIVTHTIPDEWVVEDNPFTFVTDGVEQAIRLAKEAAGFKNVAAGGAQIARHCLNAGLLDEIHIHLVPVLLGQGVRLFEHLGVENVELECTKTVPADGVTHLQFRVVK